MTSRTVNRQQCQIVPKQECRTVNKESCSNVPRQVCRDVPKQQCRCTLLSITFLYLLSLTGTFRDRSVPQFPVRNVESSAGPSPGAKSVAKKLKLIFSILQINDIGLVDSVPQ